MRGGIADGGVAVEVAGGEVARRVRVVGLVGNPNTGKSTIFNRLTGLRQRIANYPGITTEAKVGQVRLPGGELVDLIDLPGAYSLSAASLDEQVVVDVITGHAREVRPDLLVCVLDATNLKRNLFLVSQLAEYERPMVLVLNQWDEALKRGIAIDVRVLEDELGVRVVTTVGTKGTGLMDLQAAIEDGLENPRRMRRIVWRGCVVEACKMLRDGLRGRGVELCDAELQRLLFDCRATVRDRLPVAREEASELVSKAREIIRRSGLNPAAAEAILHYERMDAVLTRAAKSAAKSLRAGDESIDALLVHRFWGLVVFVAIMWVVFQSVYAWASPFMDAIEAATGWVQEQVAPMLEGMPVFQSLVTDGIIGGVGGVLVFLPQIFILFFFIAVLEDSGYMARAAFLMDKLFGWCGLNGKSFVPLLSSYACAIPGIMAARSLEDPKARLTTVLLAPFMSCSARLPVYVLFIGAFVEPVYGAAAAGWALFAMHFIGLVVGLPLAWALNTFVLKTRHQPFILEMTGYKIPDTRNVVIKMWEGGREFLLRAGTVILAFSVIIWALLYFPRAEEVAELVRGEFVAKQAAELGMTEAMVEKALEEEGGVLAKQLEIDTEAAYIEQSYLGRFGRALQPAFELAGFDWKITVGVLSSFPAREVIIATLGIIYHMGSDVDEESEGLRERMAAEKWTTGPRAGQPVFTMPVVFAIMVFFALCMQCGATVAVMAKQIGWNWACMAFVGMTVLAWLAAVATYQLGMLLIG